jgi:hypothetical protein
LVAAVPAVAFHCVTASPVGAASATGPMSVDAKATVESKPVRVIFLPFSKGCRRTFFLIKIFRQGIRGFLRRIYRKQYPRDRRRIIA